mgnify:CR=1 FL=1
MFHGIATMSSGPAPRSGQLGGFVALQLFKSLAAFLQYLVPVALLIGAGVSGLRQMKRQRLHAAAVGGGPGAIASMSWREFERLIGEAFRRRGFAVTETGGDGPDGGVDLTLKKNGERYLVQCKHWRAQSVGVSIVRELYGVMAARCAVGGFVVTSGRFSDEAADFAKGRNIELIDGKRLGELIGSVRPQKPRTRLAPGEESLAKKPDELTGAETAPDPACPRCGAPMVRRVAKQGSNAGKPFWGCSTFPKCGGIVRISDPIGA